MASRAPFPPGPTGLTVGRSPVGVLFVALLLGAACSSEVPAAQAFAGAGDAGAGDVRLGGVDEAADVAVADGGPQDGAPIAADMGGGGHDAGGSPTCYEALDCLLKKKLWKPGEPLPDGGDCMSGIGDAEAMEADALFGCVKVQCKAEFDAFYAGSGAELPALYGCMIERCAKTIAVCVGGEGKATCLESLQCLQKCPPLDDACSLPCLKSTTPYQSQKTGAVLQCIFADCTLATLSACPTLQSCGAKCYIGG